MGSLTDQAHLVEEVAELRAANQRLMRRLAKRDADTHALVEEVYRAARDAAVTVGMPQPVQRPDRDRRRGPEVALAHFTDWQLAKTTATYDIDVCAERVRRAAAKVVRVAEVQRADHPVRECVVLLGGDMVEGVTVFPGQAFEVSASAFEQVFEAAALVEQVIVTLLGAFERVTVHCALGNHGRLGRRGDHPRGDNLDAIVYRVAQDRLSAQGRLTWHAPERWYQIVEVGNYRAMLVHGDQIKSFGGQTPAYGIIRKATAWSSGVVEPFQDVWLGHFHQSIMFTLPNGGSVRVTGSPESDNQYAKEFVAAQSRPSQRLAFVDPVKGHVTADYILWLD